MTTEETTPRSGEQRIAGSRINKGLVIVNTGMGKGKTTAALGLMLRAWGRNMNVQMYQFLKPSTSNSGEHRAAKKLGIPIQAVGDGFTWRSKDPEKTKELAQTQWAICTEAILAGKHDMIILDEFTYTMHYGWLDVVEVIDVLKRRPEMLHVVITGRNAPQELIDYADLVTEMTVVKHPYREQGIKAQPGVEF